MKDLSKLTRKVIRDLQNDIDELENCGSNIEVIWKLEELQRQGSLLRSSEIIRKSLR